MPVRGSYRMPETVNPLSDDFFQQYGLFELSTRDEFAFNPLVLRQNDYGKTNFHVKNASPNPLAWRQSSFEKTDRLVKNAPPNPLVWRKNDYEKTDFRVKNAQLAPLPVQVPPADAPQEKLPVILAIFVRLLLIGHNVMTVWRVTVAYNDDLYWLLLISNVLMIAEGMFTIFTRGGMDYKWWCPCFFVYLASTLPSVWLLQLKQYTIAAGENTPDDTSTISPISTTTVPGTTVMLTEDSFDGVDNTTSMSTILNATMVSFMTTLANFSTTIAQNTTSDTGANYTELPTNVTSSPEPEQNITTVANVTTTQDTQGLPPPDNELWLIIIQEALIYLLVLGRWLLPRRNASRGFLADLLLEFLAIASDIMELLAVFDEPTVRTHRLLTYWVMGVWSASFIQFIPVLAHKRMFRRLKRPQLKACTTACGEHFVEVVYTCMSIFLQDGPFLVLRLYIMIRLRLITYSLVFFVLKNIVTILLLFYRLGLMCYQLPCYRRRKTKLRESVIKIPISETTDITTLNDISDLTNEKY